MFKSRDAAREAIAALCDEIWGDAWPVTSAQLEFVLNRLSPQFSFAPTADVHLGGTRLGGAPDLPMGAAWPIRPSGPTNGSRCDTAPKTRR